MKKIVNSPRKMKQSKISSFWTTASGVNYENQVQVNVRKRKVSNSVSFETPTKKMTLKVHVDGTDLLSVEPPGSRNHHSDEFDGLSFEDFENNPFLSPSKDKSPKRGGILTENHLQASEEYWRVTPSDLNFESPVRCTVQKFAVVTTGGFEQVLQVKDEKSGKTGICRLRDVWTFSPVSVNDVVVIQTSLSEDGWVVNNKTGYLVLHPNFVVSSTSLTKGMFCLRRGLLSNFYPNIESKTNAALLIGRMVHELLQKCLRIRDGAEADHSKIIAELLQSSDYIHDLYFGNVSLKNIQGEVESFIPSIRHFINVYLNKIVEPSGKNFMGSIEDVVEIEELIKAPNLGFQGRVDVTVKVNSKNRVKLMPLELKTGRASFSAEHRSQVILYILLMNEIGRKVDSGLLLYLREGILEEIHPNRDEIRNLFLLRNRLVGYYKSLKANELPEPIRSSVCENCPYQRICVTHLKSESLYQTHPLRNLDTPDLKPSHVNYFLRWSKLLWLEYGHTLDGDAENNEISKMELKPKIEQLGSEFKHDFILTQAGKSLPAGSFVSLFNGQGIKICTATVIRCTDFECSLSINRMLDDFTDRYRITIFKCSFLNMYLSNLGLLLEEKFKNLRELIVDKRKPTFQAKLDKKSFKEKCLKKMLTLNEQQQKAILKSLVCNDYLVIKGPPGTGKTETVAALVRIFVALGKKVLLAGHTNSSLDNVLLRLNDVEYLRLGKTTKKQIFPSCYVGLIKECKDVSDVQKLFDRKLIASTCASMDSDCVRKIKFDVCIVDESSQVLQCEILTPLFCAEKFILVGDEDQLSPIVQNREAKKLGMCESLFESLKGEEATIKLRLQYRMNSRINRLANLISYGGLLECANDAVANGRIVIKNKEAYEGSREWIKHTLSPTLDRSVVFLDTSDYFRCNGLEKPEKARSSRLEAGIVKTLLIHLIEYGQCAGEIGVISPFSDQIALFKGIFGADVLKDVEVNTIDQYQGRDKDVIFYSLGKENQLGQETSEFEILNDAKRTTVAITRARFKLVIVGDRKTVEKYEPCKKLLSNLNESEILRLTEDEEGFHWDNLELGPL